MEPDDHRGETCRNVWWHLGSNQHVTAAEINLFRQRQNHALTFSGNLEFAVEADNRFHPCPMSGRQCNKSVTLPDRATRDTSGKSPESGIRSDHRLNRKPQGIRFKRRVRLNRFEVLEQRWAG